MKLKITKSPLAIVIYSAFILADIVLFIYTAAPGLFKSSTDHNISYGWYNNLTPIDPPIKQNTMPEYRYRLLKLKMKTVRDLKNGDYYGWTTKLTNLIGTEMSYENDTCTIDSYGGSISGRKVYSLSLNGWKLNSTSSSSSFPGLDSVIFHVENGQSYIRKSILSAPITYKDGSIGYHVQEKDIPVKFRYSNKKHWIRIPITESASAILRPILILLQIVFIISCFYLIIIFVRFIIDLTNGLTFTEKNIRRLRIIAYCLVGYPLLLVLSNFFIRLIFNSYFTPDVIFNTDKLYQWWLTIHAGFIFMLLLNAFKKGKALQDEQALTV